ncbi:MULTISPECIES: DEAD/DEAH box helicase [unclassified Saccharopolyspora]|uniref:DEAD/DEAH box helicase n=1 Tax=unclassified Saccharopolyspora TaxID=2646250 RepID=UPI001CD44C06|nr:MULTISPECIES: DEAD/DEAH box helicase [unclassified Saccharopolyspora]MCA1186178.1 DEAD/DEAH box helicase [Saccharopolyspora sp. 6T]MCA1278381.1 DEAD/DEAH box helicase [Saccharopolyspora sp. 7B]
MSTGAPEPWSRLHPALTHHIVNTLGWRSLRPLQREAIDPVLDGDDALLLAPTAGGKTEAACFPLLSAMEYHGWSGVSVLYVCPLKALLNNLLHRLEDYTSWLGRRVGIWHGDVTASARKRLLRDPPDILLTTPESLESMLVSTHVDHAALLGDVRAIVVDEVHSFAGDDRGWHLLAVLERITRLTARPIQRVGLSATVGNPEDLLHWLQGSGRGERPGSVVAPGVPIASAAGRPDGPNGTGARDRGRGAGSIEMSACALSDAERATGKVARDTEKATVSSETSADAASREVPPGEIELDYVGSVANAATIIASLHRGEKRLVFCDSRQLVEELGAALRGRGVTTFLSHASLSLDERRQAEDAFADARDCVIVSTSTLELGIDVGDLDRVIQINAPTTVASFLQRLGRTGRRPGTSRNCLFLALRTDALLWSAALLRLWGRGFVEPVTAPPAPRHIVAQQLLALCLQNHTIGERTWPQEWNGLEPFDRTAEPILRHLIDEGFVERDGPMLFIGPEAERRFGHRHFMDMTAVFTAPPQITVLEGRREIGHTDPALLTEHVDGPRLLLLGGRSWKVTWIDWKRRRCYVEPADTGGRARWMTPGAGGVGHELARAAREVLLGADPPVGLTQRATSALAGLREKRSSVVAEDATVISRDGDDVRWWSWAGFRTNATLAASLTGLTDEHTRFDDTTIRLRGDLTREMWRAGIEAAETRLVLPDVDERALEGLKFNEALPHKLATATLAARLADEPNARTVLGERVRFVAEG